jgi:hypothetical protein
MTGIAGVTVYELWASGGIPPARFSCRQTNLEIPDGDQMNNEFAKSFSSTPVDNGSRRSEPGIGSVTGEYPQPYPHAVHTGWGVPHGIGPVIPRWLWTRRFRFAVPQRRFRRGAGLERIADMTRSGGVGASS